VEVALWIFAGVAVLYLWRAWGWRGLCPTTIVATIRSKAASVGGLSPPLLPRTPRYPTPEKAIAALPKDKRCVSPGFSPAWD
jgi:hypothetical protein